LLQRLLDEAESKQVEPYSVILAYLGLGEREQALRWLEKGCDSLSRRISPHVEDRFTAGRLVGHLPLIFGGFATLHPIPNLKK
jgi:hypothetical protein